MFISPMLRSKIRLITMIGWLAYPMCEEVTNHVLLGCKSHVGLYKSENIRSEQSVWRANLEVRRILTNTAVPKSAPFRSCRREFCVAPTIAWMGGGRSSVGRNGEMHHRSNRDMGSDI